MSKVVSVKIKGRDGFKQMAEAAALRLVQVDPQKYSIAEPPRVDVLKLPTLPPQEKKSAPPAADSAPAMNIGTAVPTEVPKPEPAATTQTTQDVIKRRGRPAKV